MPKSSFQSRFREAFGELAISQAQFARDCGMTRANVTHWMNGRGREPTAELADQAAVRLGVNLAWLLRGEGAKRPPPADTTPRHPLELDGLELTKAAIEVAAAFMDLPRWRRDQVQRELTAEVVQQRSAKPGARILKKRTNAE